MRTDKGFTLIELLVVIAIIALLLAILMPSLKKTKKVASSVVCQSNLRQWHMCWSMYLGENNNKFTPGKIDTSWEGWFGWIEMMEPYYQDETIFTCPSAAKEDQQAGSLSAASGSYTGVANSKWYAVNKNTSREFRGSYGYNYWVSNQLQNLYLDPRNYWKSDLLRSDKSNIPLFGDCMWTGGYPDDSDTPRNFEQPRTWNDQINRFVENRHYGGVCFVFVDGSNSRSDMKDIWKFKWHRNYNVNNAMTLASAVWPEWIEKAK